MPDPRGIEAGWPLAAGDRGEPSLRVRPGQLAAQTGFELLHDIRKGHGTSVIAAQALCGDGYELAVMARTTSAAMNA